MTPLPEKLDIRYFIKYNNFTDSMKGVNIMKYNFTEIQYIQMAKEQFCRILSEIPFVSDIEIIPADFRREFGDFKAVIHFLDSEDVLKFCVEVKARGERRFVNIFMATASQYQNETYYLFMAPYISEASANALRDNHYGYIDLSGNCYILTKRMLIHISGNPNKYVETRTKKNYFSKSASAASVVMRTMLNEYDKCWRVQELAEITGKAIGTVSNVKGFLLDRAWIEEYSNGFKLCNIKEMLHIWAKDYKNKDARVLEYYSLDNIAEIERGIREWNQKHGARAVIGCFSAAVRYAPTVRYNRVHVYVEQQDVDEFVKDLDLRPVLSGGNVIITIPHDETPCMYSREINEALVTSPVQTVIDLLSGGGRGEEAADAVIQKEFI